MAEEKTAEPTVEDYIEEGQEADEATHQEPAVEAAPVDADVATDEVTLEDVEIDGKTFALPPEVAARLQTPEPEPIEIPDTTPDPQEIEAARQQDQRAYELRGVMKQYENVDWAAWEQQDITAAQAGWREYSTIKDQVRDLDGAIAQRNSQDGQRKQDRFMKTVEAGQKVLQRDIKGWGKELAETLTQYASEQGMSQQQIVGMNADPAAVKLLHKAYLQDQSTKQSAAKPAPNVVPLKSPTKGKGKPATVGLADALPIDEWMKRHQRMKNEG